MKLKELVQIHGAFTEAVDIKLSFGDESANTELLEKFLPNDATVETLLSVARAINMNSKERAHLISGAYGTGKSLIGLVIANYFYRPELAQLQGVLSAIEQDWPQEAQELRRLRSTVSDKYLPVLIQGNEADTVNEGLLSGLKKALVENQLANLIPRTAFETACERIETWRTKYYDRMYSPCEKLLQDKGWPIARLIDELRQCREQAYRIFEEVYLEVTGGPFEPFKTEREAAQFYAQVSKELRLQNTAFEGIVIIWDEYGDRLREVALGPSRGKDYLGEQLFAQYCKYEGEDQVHYITVAHLSQRDYFDSDLDYANYQKSTGRLKESRITIQRAEEVIGQAILQLFVENEAGWQELRKRGNWQDAFATIKSLGLFPDQSNEWIREKVVEGCFPLHPCTLYCLPRLSERVGQFNRTSLSFLNDSVSGLKGFVEDESNEAFIEPGRLNLYPVDKLFDYFQTQIEKSDQFRKVYRGYLAGSQFVSDPLSLAVRILKVIAVLEVIQDPKLRPSEDIIYTCLYLPAYERGGFEEALASLEKVGAIKKRPNGEYRFLRGGDYDYQEDFRLARDEVLRGLTNPVQTLNRELSLSSLYALDYNSHKFMDRRLDQQYVEVSALANTKPFEEETEKSPYRDGWILYVVARSDKEIADAKRWAQQITHSQIVIAIPKKPTELVDRLIDKLAADKVVSELLAKGLSYTSDEVEEARMYRDEQYRLKLTTSHEDFLQPSQLTWYWRGNIISVPNVDGLHGLASDVMNTVFPDTPKIAQERIAFKWKKSSRPMDRLNAITELLDAYSPVKLRRSARGRGPSDAIFRASLLDTGLLDFVQAAGDNDYYEIKEPDASAPAYKLWHKIDSIFSTENSDSILREAIIALYLPPFGLSGNAIEVSVGAYMRRNRSRLTVTHIYSGTLTEFTGDTIQSMVTYPESYRVVYRVLAPKEQHYINNLHALVTGISPPVLGVSPWEVEKGLRDWFSGLSPEQCTTEEISQKARELRDAISTVVTFPGYSSLLSKLYPARAADNQVTSTVTIHELIFTLIPEALGLPSDVKSWDDEQMNEFTQSFQLAKDEIERFGKVKVEVIATTPRPTGGVTEEPSVAVISGTTEELRQRLTNLLQEYLQKIPRQSIQKIWEEVGRTIFHDQDNQ